MDCSLPGSSVHGILQARILEWVAMSSSRGSSQPRMESMSLLSPALAGRFFTTSTTWEVPISGIEFSSVAQSGLTLCNPMNRSTSGLPVHHQLLESTQTHVHWVSDAIQQSHPLLSPSPSALNHSQHQGLFKWVSSSHQVAKVLEFQLHHQSFHWTLRMDWLDLLAVILKQIWRPHIVSLRNTSKINNFVQDIWT